VLICSTVLQDNNAAGCHMSRRQRGRLEAIGAHDNIREISAQLMAKLGIHEVSRCHSGVQ